MSNPEDTHQGTTQANSSAEIHPNASNHPLPPRTTTNGQPQVVPYELYTQLLAQNQTMADNMAQFSKLMETLMSQQNTNPPHKPNNQNQAPGTPAIPPVGVATPHPPNQATANGVNQPQPNGQNPVSHQEPANDQQGGQQNAGRRREREEQSVNSPVIDLTKRTRTDYEEADQSVQERLDAVCQELRELKKNKEEGDQGLGRSNSPLSKEIQKAVVPDNFKMPKEKYDGTGDPQDHVVTYEATLDLYGISDEIKCRTFPTTLRGSARNWFYSLPAGSVKTFGQLNKLFVGHFLASRK